MKITHILTTAALGVMLAACQPPAATTEEAPATTEAAVTTEEVAPVALPCGVLAQRNWEAEFAAGARATLTISGEIDLPRPGYSVSLARDPAGASDSTEPHLILSLRPPTGMTTEVVTPHAVRYFGPASVLYTTVHITCDGAPLTDVTVPPPQ